MENISYCRYLTTPGVDWSDDHYRSRDIVKAIKGEQFGGYTHIPVDGLSQRLDASNPQIAFGWFVEQVLEQTEFDDGLYSLVPIPDRQRTPASTHLARTLVLAQKLVERLPNQFGIWDHLRFRKPMPEKTRDEEKLFANMVCTSDKPPAGFHTTAAARANNTPPKAQRTKLISQSP